MNPYLAWAKFHKEHMRVLNNLMNAIHVWLEHHKKKP